MAKVRCNICDNETNGFCAIKKVKVNVNKSRKCEAYIFNEAKIKAKTEVNTIRVGYQQLEDNKKRMKAEMKKLKEEAKKGPGQGTAQNLGLVESESRIIKPGDPRFVMPNRDDKHPLTGDLSRFTTTANDKE